MSPSTPTNTTRSRIFAGLSAGFIVGIVIIVYATALRHGHYPPSHPWSGMALLLLAAQGALGAAAGQKSRSRSMAMALVSALGAVAAVCWLLAS